jgi:hypothetical protein
MLRFRRMRSLQKFAAVHASVYDHFNQERSLSTRPNFKLNRATALAEWRGLGAVQGAVSHSIQRLVRIRLAAPPSYQPDAIAAPGTEHVDASVQATARGRLQGR